MDVQRKAQLIAAAMPLIENLSDFQRSSTLRQFEIYSRGSLLENLQEASDESLLAIAEALNLFESEPSVFTFIGSTAGNPLIVFASHIHAHQAFVGQVATYLKQYGIELFVAHISISPNSVWRNVIVQKLDSSHAGVAFLHAGFKASDWCSQEVGWLLGRHIPITSFYFDEAPVAFLGELQANSATLLTPTEVGVLILEFIKSKNELNSKLIDSLVSALNISMTYAQTGMIWDQLKLINSLSVGQCSKLMDALESNNQVYEPHDWNGGTYRDHICNYLQHQTGYFGVENRVAYFRANRMS